MTTTETMQAASVLLKAMEDLTVAITLLANNVGGKADGVDVIIEEPEPLKFTFLEVKAAFMEYAKNNGKKAATDLLNKYTENMKISAVKEGDYIFFMGDIDSGA